MWQNINKEDVFSGQGLFLSQSSIYSHLILGLGLYIGGPWGAWGVPCPPILPASVWVGARAPIFYRIHDWRTVWAYGIKTEVDISKNYKLKVEET